MRVTISAIIITIAACFISQVVSDLGRSGEPSRTRREASQPAGSGDFRRRGLDASGSPDDRVVTGHQGPGVDTSDLYVPIGPANSSTSSGTVEANRLQYNDACRNDV